MCYTINEIISFNSEIEEADIKMRDWLRKIGYKLQNFMSGRYGGDELSRFLSIIAIVLVFVSLIPSVWFLYIVAFALLALSLLRSFSRNITKRQRELMKYLKIRHSILQKFRLIKNKWHYRKTHRYYKCPNCKATVRIRKPEKGKCISIHCPKCGGDFEKNT